MTSQAHNSEWIGYLACLGACYKAREMALERAGKGEEADIVRAKIDRCHDLQKRIGSRIFSLIKPQSGGQA